MRASVHPGLDPIIDRLPRLSTGETDRLAVTELVLSRSGTAVIGLGVDILYNPDQSRRQATPTGRERLLQTIVDLFCQANSCEKGIRRKYRPGDFF